MHGAGIIIIIIIIIIIRPVLQKKKLKLREAKRLTQDHSASTGRQKQIFPFNNHILSLSLYLPPAILVIYSLCCLVQVPQRQE